MEVSSLQEDSGTKISHMRVFQGEIGSILETLENEHL